MTKLKIYEVYMEYPVSKPSTVPSSGHKLYNHLMNNVKVPAESSHMLWYNGVRNTLKSPELYAFRGWFPLGSSMELNLKGKEVVNFTIDFVKELIENNRHIFVSDLTERTRKLLNIPVNAKEGDKVYNCNFVEYKDLPKETRISNELTTLSLAKSISAYLCRTVGMHYTEQDVAVMLTTAVTNLGSKEMMYILNNNHLQWVTLNYIRDGKVQPDTLKEFYAQSDIEFYSKDVGTILPSIFYTTAMIGISPVDLVYNSPSIKSIWGAMDVAEYMDNKRTGQKTVNE